MIPRSESPKRPARAGAFAAARIVIFSAFVAFVGLASISPARGDTFAQLYQRPGGKALTGLSFDPPSPKIEIEGRWSETGPVTYVALRGRFAHPGWTLISGSRKIQLASDGRFRILVPVTGKVTRLNLTAIGLRGEVEMDPLEISFPEYEAYLKELRPGSRGRFRLNAGLNFSFIDYQDPRISNFSEKAITAKAGASFLLVPRWSIEGGAYFTVLPVSESSGDAAYAKDTARFLGLNLRIAYQVPAVKEPWGLSLQAGGYYTTMFVANNDFGFVNMAGPELFPVLRRTFAGGNSVMVYAKFSPVTTAVDGSFLDNREIAGGAAYAFGLRGGRTFSLTVDVSSFQLVFPTATVSSTSFSVGFGYSLL